MGLCIATLVKVTIRTLYWHAFFALTSSLYHLAKFVLIVTHTCGLNNARAVVYFCTSMLDQYSCFCCEAEMGDVPSSCVQFALADIL